MQSERKFKWSTLIGILCIALCLFFFEQWRQETRLSNSATRTDAVGITQVATIDSLLAGVYDGETTLEELSRYGNFGIGTFQGLDGEMVLLDGEFYQVKADGGVHRPELRVTTPFASVAPFPTRTKNIVTQIVEPMDFEALCEKIDALAPNPNVPVLVKLNGRFSNVRTRSVPAQEKPYPPLVEVTRHQPEFELGTLAGDVVGFRLPQYVRGINVPGYHLHFLCENRKRGGHLLQLRMDSGTIELSEVHRFEVLLPKSVTDFAAVDLSRDRSEELEKVEK